MRYTGWEEVLAGSKHDLVTTAAFTATATATEPELERLIQSWERILQRSLDTLIAVSNYKDILASMPPGIDRRYRLSGWCGGRDLRVCKTLVLTAVTINPNSRIHHQTHLNRRDQDARTTISPAPTHPPAIGPFDSVERRVWRVDLHRQWMSVCRQSGKHFRALAQKASHGKGVATASRPLYSRVSI